MGSTGRQICRRTAAPVCRAATAGNIIGAHSSVWVGGWTEEDVRRSVRGAKTAGYDLVEVATLDPVSFLDKADMTRELMQEAGLQVSNSLGLPADCDINSEDSECVRKGKEMLLQTIEVAERMGSNHICGILYSAFQKYPGPTTVAARRNSVAAIREVASVASDKGITLGMEVVNRYETNLLNTAAQAMDYVTDVNADNVVVHLDTYHMNIEENSAAEAVKICGGKLGYVHVGESHRGYLGTGSVDFRGLFDALVEIDYRGPITFESFSNMVVHPSLSSTLAVWREMWDDPDDLAIQAKAFIDSHLAMAKASRILRK